MSDESKGLEEIGRDWKDWESISGIMKYMKCWDGLSARCTDRNKIVVNLVKLTYNQ